MTPRDRLWKTTLVILGLLAAAFFITTKNSNWLNYATAADFCYGDLYALAKVRNFRPPEPILYGPSTDDDSLDAGQIPRPADVIFIGDSFGFALFSQPPFWRQLSENTGWPIFSIYNNHHKDIWRSPYSFLDGLEGGGESGGLLVFEISERLLADVFADAIPNKTAIAPARPWTRLEESLLRKTAERHQFLFKHGQLTAPLITGWNTTLFNLAGIISKDTPLYSTLPPFLFYREEVRCFRTEHDEEQVSAMADHIALFAETLRRDYRRQLLFVPVPNKITLYSALATPKPYDEFLPRLCRALRERGVLTVDMLPQFRAQKTTLFWSTDTHWNPAGIRLGVRETLKVWPSDFRQAR